jgi:ABC-type nitrate/sulfonate/bicarbonate transport system ATPase subunit
MGVVTGEMLVDGRPRDQSFQRKTGYVQQQDLHLHTTTVREALRFSALLRQPAHVPRQEKIDYVEEVIKLLGMESYADAVVGVPGEGMSFDTAFVAPLTRTRSQCRTTETSYNRSGTRSEASTPPFPG